MCSCVCSSGVNGILDVLQYQCVLYVLQHQFYFCFSVWSVSPAAERTEEKNLESSERDKTNMFLKWLTDRWSTRVFNYLTKVWNCTVLLSWKPSSLTTNALVIPLPSGFSWKTCPLGRGKEILHAHGEPGGDVNPGLVSDWNGMAPRFIISLINHTN